MPYSPEDVSQGKGGWVHKMAILSRMISIPEIVDDFIPFDPVAGELESSCHPILVLNFTASVRLAKRFIVGSHPL